MDSESGGSAEPRLLADDDRLRSLAAALGLAYILPLASGPYARVFKARGARGAAVAVKCLEHVSLAEQASSKSIRWAQREREMARWAAERELGPPILRQAVLPLATCIVMPCAATDLQLFWQRQARAASLTTIRQLWRDAFALATALDLCEGRWVGADLKPANLLLYRRARGGWKVWLNDFDARFWRQASSPDAAGLLNTLVLLSNTLFLLPLPAVVPHLPDHAATLLHRFLMEDPALLELVQRNLPWLQRGLLHYSRAARLPEHMKLLRARAALHGFTG